MPTESFIMASNLRSWLIAELAHAKTETHREALRRELIEVDKTIAEELRKGEDR